jgi:hypothetical protein
MHGRATVLGLAVERRNGGRRQTGWLAMREKGCR